ncbi:MAG: GIDE domain-containing protein [Candidatus Omnitrophota bacterium]
MSSSDDSEGKFFMYLCVGFVLGIVGFFRGFQLRKRKKLIEDIPTSTVRALALGLAEVSGTARESQKLLTSDFSKTPCVFYHYKVEEYRSSGKSGSWVTLAEHTSTEYFYLEDKTGRVLICPAGAELHVHMDRKYSNGIGTKDKNLFLAQLDSMGIAASGTFGFGKQLRCEEAYIVPGDELYVIGTVQPNPVVRGSAQGFENLCVAAQPGAFFLLSSESEKHVLGEFSGRMYLFLYGGPILTVVCLFILIGHFFKHLF